MIKERWHVAFTRRDLPVGGEFAEWLEGLDQVLDKHDVLEGTPYLLSPSFEYDVELNGFFLSPVMSGGSLRTQEAYARDMAGFFSFLWRSRGRTGGRQASEADHLAYKAWRTRVLHRAGSTWGREVAAVNTFYVWAWGRGLVAMNPIPQRARKPRPDERRRGRDGGTTPSTGPHNQRREKVEPLTPEDYRLWRDVGLRGYGADGLPRGGFRGRWEARNAAFADLMVRTGLRLEEESSLTVFEVPVHPAPRGTGFQRFWLPESIAKGASARWIYVPVPLVRELAAYSEFDRPEAIDYARSRGIYNQIRRPLIIEDPDRPEVLVLGQHGTRHLTKLALLTPAERRRVLIDGPDGLEPAAFWLSEQGRPVALSTWKGLFADANRRCAEQGSDLRCHPHMLRHTFAVVTLEQLQRGHIQNLAGLSAEQRTHYTRVFGDPADWVRRRLGHASQTTTLKYWNYLAELEMTTRMALVPDTWDDPRLTPLAVIGDDHDDKAEDVAGASR